MENEKIKNVMAWLNIIKGYADYIVDGQFQLDKKDLRLKFRGSSNQRIWEKRNGEWYS